MSAYHRADRLRLYHGDCIEVMSTLPDACIDSVVTDPPYGLEFMNKDWDKLGADIVDHAADGTYATSPQLRSRVMLGTSAVSAQGWHQRWATEALRVAKPGAYLTAFSSPRTQHRMAVAIEDAGWELRDCLLWLYGTGFPKSLNLAGDYEGWGTALKPAYEPVVLARKPFKRTLAYNVGQYGTGAINIAATRNGRWPTNVLLDDPERLGEFSRYFYTVKAPAGQREFGLDDLEPTRRSDGREKDIENPRLRTSARRNDHATVKPVELMAWLCRLVTPPRGIVLDPFVGSGSTGIAALNEEFKFVGIDQDAHYLDIAMRRITRRTTVKIVAASDHTYHKRGCRHPALPCICDTLH